MDITKLQKLLKTDHGKPLKDFLLNYYKKLGNINSIRDCQNAEDQAVELKAHKKAINLIEEMLSQLISLEDFKDEKGSEKDSVVIE